MTSLLEYVLGPVVAFITYVVAIFGLKVPNDLAPLHGVAVFASLAGWYVGSIEPAKSSTMRHSLASIVLTAVFGAVCLFVYDLRGYIVGPGWTYIVISYVSFFLVFAALSFLLSVCKNIVIKKTQDE